MNDPGRRWWTIRQTASALQINIQSCYAMAARGELPVARITRGRKGLRVDGRELERRLEAQVSRGQK